jgi:hypothetical protein
MNHDSHPKVFRSSLRVDTHLNQTLAWTTDIRAAFDEARVILAGMRNSPGHTADAYLTSPAPQVHSSGAAFIADQMPARSAPLYLALLENNNVTHNPAADHVR